MNENLTLESFIKDLTEKRKVIFPLAGRLYTSPWSTRGPDGTHRRVFWGMCLKPNTFADLGGTGYSKYTFVFYSDYGAREICGNWHRFNNRDEDLILCNATGIAPKHIAEKINNIPAGYCTNSISHGDKQIRFEGEDFLKECENLRSAKKGSVYVFYTLKARCSTYSDRPRFFRTTINGREFTDERKYREIANLLKPIRCFPNDHESIL